MVVMRKVKASEFLEADIKWSWCFGMMFVLGF